MKKNYIAPKMDVIQLDSTNIIATSGSIVIGGEGDFDARTSFDDFDSDLGGDFVSGFGDFE